MTNKEKQKTSKELLELTKDYVEVLKVQEKLKVLSVDKIVEDAEKTINTLSKRLGE